MNRSGYLIRQLTYYADVGCKHTVYVGDLSADQHARRTQEAIRKLENRVRIVYVQLPSATDYQATNELSQRVEEPYIAFTGDDDFLIPASLEKCARFLDASPDYESAHGVGILFALGSGREYGEFVSSTACPQRPAEHTSARLRLMDLLNRYWPVSFSVQRVEAFRVAVDLAPRLPDKGFRELLTDCLSIIRGKAKELDCLYLARQAHYQQNPSPDWYDLITSPAWLFSYQVFHDCLVEKLARQDKVSTDEARELVKQVFRSYLASVLGGNSASPRSSLRRTARVIPGVRMAWNTWNTLRSLNPPGPGKFSLPGLLRPTSQYHAAFMPIYRAVTTPPPVLLDAGV
jgi:glycosyltransferase domain-containing protein